jgi:hypothetical protein
MGRCFAAQRRPDRQVALKVTQRGTGVTTDDQRFQAKGSRGAVDHANIASIYEA